MKKRLLVPISMALLAMAMFGGVASAAQPAEQGCLGETISYHAQASGSGWGQGISFDAQRTDWWWPDSPGIAGELAWVKAGKSEFLPSSCSDLLPLPE